jgi:F-type H+-transporting ATPase subunit b
MEGIGINLPLLIAFVVNFLLLFGLLGVFLYKPVLKVLDERAGKIKDSMEQAEKIKVQLEKTESEIKQQMELARKEGQKIIAQAEQIGERLKTEAKDEARREA